MAYPKKQSRLTERRGNSAWHYPYASTSRGIGFSFFNRERVPERLLRGFFKASGLPEQAAKRLPDTCHSRRASIVARKYLKSGDKSKAGLVDALNGGRSDVMMLVLAGELFNRL